MNSSVSVSITGTVNAGICIAFPNGRRIWFDLYPVSDPGYFSRMKPEMWEDVKKDPRIAPPDLILFSHTHPDHFSPERTAEVRRMWPDVPVLLPEGSRWHAEPITGEAFGFTPVHGDEYCFDLDGIRIRMVRTVHSGKQYIDVPHYSFFITCDKKTVFISGDAHLTDDDLAALLESTKTDLAVLTFPWASTSIGRERVEYCIQPSHVLLYHIPDTADDIMNYRSAAVSGAGHLKTPDVRLLMTPMQTEVFEL